MSLPAYGPFGLRDKVRRGNIQNFGYLEEHNDVRRLDTSLYEAYERAVQSGCFSKLFLRQILSLPGLA